VSLSIFNFKKYFLIFITITSISIIFFVFGSEYIVRKFVSNNSDYEKVRSDLWNKKNDYAAFSDSRGANGLQQTENFSNFSIRGNNLKTILKMAKFYLDRNNVKGIIIQLDPHLFSVYRLQKNQEIMLEDLLTNDRHFLHFQRPQYKQYLIEYWISFFKKFNNLFFKNISENNISTESKKTLDLEKNVEIRVQMHVPVKKYKESEHLEILMNLIKTLKQKQIKLCLITFPVKHVYFKKSQKYPTFIEIIRYFQLIGEKEKIKYINYSNSLNDYFFGDPDHLNIKGANYFSKLVLRDCFGEMK